MMEIQLVHLRMALRLVTLLVCLHTGKGALSAQSGGTSSSGFTRGTEIIQQQVLQGHYRLAERMCIDSARHHKGRPNDQLPFVMQLGTVLRLQADFEGAFACYQECAKAFQDILEHDPIANAKLVEGYCDLATELSHQPAREKAILLASQTIGKLPHDSELRGVLARKIGILHRILKNNAAARTWFLNADGVNYVHCEERIRLQNELAYLALREGDTADAIRQLNLAKPAMAECRSLSPEDWVTHHFYTAEYWGAKRANTDLMLQCLEMEQVACKAGIAIGEKFPEICPNYLYACYNRYALLLSELGDITGAIPLAQQYLDGQLHRRSYQKGISQAYSNLALFHHYLGRFDDALSYYRQAWLEYPKGQSDPNGMAVTRLANYAQELINTGKYAEGEPLMQDAIRIFVANQPDDYCKLAADHQNLGIGYLYQKKYELSVKSLLEAVETYQKADHVPWNELCYTRVNLALAYEGLGNKEEASKQIATAKREKQLISTNNPVDRSMVLEVITDYYLQESNYEAALALNADFMAEMRAVAVSDDPLQCPDLDQAVSPLYALTAASQKASILWGLFQKTSDVAYLHASLGCSRGAIARLRKMRQEQNGEQEKLKINQRWETLFAQAMQAAMALYQETDDPQFLQSTFEISEQSKAMLLMEAMLDNRVLQNNPKSAPLVERRQRLQIRISSLRDAINGAVEKETLASLQRQLIEANRDLDQVVQEIQTTNPKYSQLVNAFDVIRVEELQPLLREDQRTLLEYFYADSVVYAMVVGPSEFVVKKLALKDGFTANLDSLMHQLHSGPANNSHASSQKFAEWSTAVINTIWRPIEPWLTEHVTVIPDGPLSFLSFEALVDSTEAAEELKLQHLHYLAERYFITYDYSGTFLAKRDKNPPVGTPSVLAVAPSFGPSSALRALPDALEGAKKRAEDYVGVSALLDTKATKSAFLDAAGKHEVLDLATHGTFDRNNFLDSRIYFSPDGAGDSIIELSELYELNLPARLAILEACETGLGDYHQGEGVMSLARGFTYAGCKSVLMSLWEVNEGTPTAHIMERFYTHLADSLHLDEAITQSKREFLRNARATGGAALIQTHPFFWSELVLIGDHGMLPLQKKSAIAHWMLWVGTGAALSFLAAFWIRKRKRAVNAT